MEHHYITISRSVREVDQKSCAESWTQALKGLTGFMGELVALATFWFAMFAICMVAGG